MQPRTRSHALRVALVIASVHFALSFALFAFMVANPSSEGGWLWLFFYVLDWPTIFLIEQGINDLQLMVFPVSWYAFTSVSEFRLFFASVLGGSIQWFGIGFLFMALLGRLRHNANERGAQQV
jgi:hypothetical protein